MAEPLRNQLRRFTATPGARAFLQARERVDPRDGKWSVVADVTRGCNLRCPMCTQDDRPHALAAPSLWDALEQRVLPHAAELAIGCRHEPLLHPELPHQLGRLRQACDDGGWPVSLCVLTSGTLLRDRLTDALLDARPHALLLSIDTVDDEAYAAVRPPARWSRVRPRVETLTRRATGGPTSLAVQSLIMRRTIDHLARTVTALSALGLSRFQLTQLLVTPAEDEVVRAPGSSAVSPQRAADEALAVGAQLGVEIRGPVEAAPPLPEEPYPLFGEGDVWDEDRLAGQREAVCVTPWAKLRIDHEGWIFPCPLKTDRALSWGNLLDASLPDIINSPAAMRTRRLLLAGRAPDATCGACPYGPR